MTGLAKLPLCGACDNGWIYDETGDEPVVEQCPCRHPQTTPAELRDAGLAGTAEANPEAFKAALRIIRETALTMPVFSSNDTRARMKLAQIPGATIGAAFRQAAKDRVIVRTGYTASTDLGTHLHPVVEWESRIFRASGTAS